MKDFRCVPGFSGLSVDDCGNVYRDGIPSSARCSSRGYPVLTVKDASGRKRVVYIHRLVCLAFHGLPPTAKHQVAHFDGDRANNNPENLRWATAKENAADKERHGTSPEGERNPRAVLTKEQVEHLRNNVKVPPGRKRLPRHSRVVESLAASYGVTPETIRNAIRGDTWNN